MKVAKFFCFCLLIVTNLWTTSSFASNNNQMSESAKTLCQALDKAWKRHIDTGQIKYWSRMKKGVDKHTQRYPEDKLALEKCEEMAKTSKYEKPKPKLIDYSKLKNEGKLDFGITYHTVPRYSESTPYVDLIAGSANELVNECNRNDNKVCITPEFSKILCEKVQTVSTIWLNSWKYKHEIAAVLLENGGFRKLESEYSEQACKVGIQVEGLYQGTTVNRAFWSSGGAYFINSDGAIGLTSQY